jgi:hypothetical protein
MTCPASSTTRWANATVRRRWRASATSSAKASARRRSCPTCARRTGRGPRSTRRSAWPRRCRRCRSAAPGGSAYRANLKLAAPLSAGIRLGHETGFDSGSTLDYVYRNQAQGAGPLGRLVDRHYLNAIGWRGIRVRKGHVEELLGLAMAQLAAQGLAVRVVDIAAGHGRYVLDAVAQAPQRPQAVLLRDYSPINVRDGRALITRRGLGDLARFEQADAFDRASLAAMRLGPQDAPPTLAVVSGLYELFADNELVARSLAGLADALPAGARLVYTGQPWHPQLEMIARALTSHRQGQAWVMRRRTQQELDQLVAAAGFCKLTQRVDEWGIFTVSLAERVRA